MGQPAATAWSPGPFGIAVRPRFEFMKAVAEAAAQDIPVRFYSQKHLPIEHLAA